MADTTTLRGYPYPEATDHTRMWEWFEALADALDVDIDGIAKKGACRIVQTVAQTGLTDNTAFAVTFSGTDILDPNGWHNPASNNTRVIPDEPGWYTVRGGLCVSGQTDYVNVEAYARQNGTTPIEPATMLTTNTVANTLVLPVAGSLVAFNGSTDYIELIGRMDRAAGTGSTAVSAQRASVLEVIYERPL